MKLRTKLLLESLGVLLAALIISGLLLMAAGWRSTCGTLTDYAVAEQQILSQHFSMEFNRRQGENHSVSADMSLAKYLFRALATDVEGSTWYILGGAAGEYLINDSELDPAAVRELLYRRPPAEWERLDQAGILRRNGKYYCIAVGGETGDGFSVSLVRDVTGTMKSLLSQMILSAGLCLVILVFSAWLLSFLVRRAFAPVEALRRGAEAIAAGQYGNRLPTGGTDEIGSLALSFNHMAQAVEGRISEVEARLEERQMLLSALAHEMRTPVTAISGYAHALRSAKLTREQQAEAVDFVDRESRRLERLATKLSELMTLEHQTIEKKEISNEALGRELGRVLAGREGVQMEIAAAGTVPGDGDLLLSLLINLADNAKKAGADRISLSLTPEAFTVTDNGGGIPPEELEKICQPFYRVDRARSREGFGFGLALCQRIAALHGGRLEFESQVGKGTRVSLVFTGASRE